MCTRTALQLLFFEPYQAWLADGEQVRTYGATGLWVVEGDGDCGDEEYCDAGQCQSVHFQGNTCLKPDEFAQDQLPLSAHGDISPASPFTSEFSSALCGATEARDGRFARDQVWSFVAPIVGD